MCEFPFDLNQNENCSLIFSTAIDGQYLLNLNLSSDTSWEEANNESAVLTIFIDGVYNNDIVRIPYFNNTFIQLIIDY